MNVRRLVLTGLAVLALAVGGAGLWQSSREPPPRTPDAVAQEVAESLRCPTCQGLSVADSNAPMAAGMRRIIREQAEAGRSPEEIRGYFTQRYGEWILLDPPRRGLTWLLWLLPVLAVPAGAVLAARAARKRPDPVLDEAQLARAAAVYDDYLTGRHTPDDSPGGERVAAALELLESLDEDPPPETEGDDARRLALSRLAAALAEPEPATAAADPPADDEPEDEESATEETGTGSLAARRRRAAWAVLNVGIVLAAALLLLNNLGERGPGGVPTGVLAPERGAVTAAQPGVDDQAVDRLLARTETRQRDPAAWIALGQAYDSRGDLAAAYGAYHRALRLDPGNVTARQLTARTLIRGGSHTEALTVLKPLESTHRDDPQTMLLLGLARHGAEDPKASKTLRHYLELAPDGPMAEYVRALLDTE
ncbi:MAG: cytochrome c-type biogenesis protein CcmH [Micromonosporaceae bacterium]